VGGGGVMLISTVSIPKVSGKVGLEDMMLVAAISRAIVSRDVVPGCHVGVNCVEGHRVESCGVGD